MVTKIIGNLERVLEEEIDRFLELGEITSEVPVDCREISHF